MTSEQESRLLVLMNRLLRVAVQVGPLHAHWDPISDIDCFLKGKPTVLQKTAEEWIAYGEQLLQGKRE